MSAQPYREAAVDLTEIEIARVKEVGTTERHAIDAKIKDREHSRMKRYEAWKESECLPVIAVFFAITCCAVVILFCIHLWFYPR